MNAEELINFRALSRHLTGKPTNIHAGNVPKKYAYKVRLLVFFIDMWLSLIKVEDEPINFK